jgi:hypothetical protein
MANTLAFSITATNSATKAIQDFTKRVNQIARPFQDMQRSLQQFGRASGFGVVKAKLEGLTRGAKRVAESFAKIGAPLIALVGGGTIAGLFALTAGWARFGLQVSQTARILGVNTQELYNFQNAARLVGISGQAATQTFQSFADTLQDARFGRNQQAFGLLQGLGIHLKNTKSGSIDSMDALGKVADKIHQFQKQGNFGAARTVANQLGLTSLMPFLMNGRKGIEALEVQARKLSGAMDWKQAQTAALQWNALSIAMEGTKNTIAAALLPTITPLVQQFGAWIQANRTLIATDLRDFVKGVGNAFRGLTLKTVLDDILAVVKGMLSLVTEVAKVVSGLGGLKTVLQGVAALWVGDKIVKYGLGFWKLTQGVNVARKALLAYRAAQVAAAGGGGAATATGTLATVGALGGAAAAGIGLGWGLDKLFPNNPLARFGNWIGGSVYDRTHRAQNVMSYFRSQGWTRAQAAGIAANIQTESGFNPRAVGDRGAAYGIGQWHADRQGAFNTWALRNKLPGLRQADLLEQLQFYNYELRRSPAGKKLAGATNAYDAGAAVSLYDERPADAAGQAAMRGDLATRIAGPAAAAPPVNLSVQTTVHRDGSATTRVTTPSGVKVVNTSPTAGVT